MPCYAIFEVFDRGDYEGLRVGQMRPRGLTRGLAPVSAFQAATPELACQAAARATRSLTSYVAIECTPWGIDVMEADGATELGAEPARAVAELEASGLEE
jgi:hypothetical protein